jgi:hypothetical protein
MNGISSTDIMHSFPTDEKNDRVKQTIRQKVVEYMDRAEEIYKFLGRDRKSIVSTIPGKSVRQPDQIDEEMQKLKANLGGMNVIVSSSSKEIRCYLKRETECKMG